MNKIVRIIIFSCITVLNCHSQCWSILESGGNHTVGIHQDGTLWAWGSNSNGEIGNGTTNNTNLPVLISGATNWVSISAGHSYSLAMKSDGTIWSWGYDVHNALGQGGVTQINVPTQIGTATDWVYISAGHSTSFAIKSDGSLWGWGINLNGEIGDGSITPKTVPTRVGMANNWAKVFTGNNFTAAIKTNGTLWTWGSYNNSGELGYGNYSSSFIPQQVGTATNWASVSTEMNFGLALKTDGTIWGWGENNLGQLGFGTASPFLSPTQIGTDSNWKQVEAGNWRSFFIKTNGTLWATGIAFLGNGTSNDTNTLVQIGTGTNWKTVSSQLFQTIGLQNTNIGYGWGSNYFGQIGTGYTDNGLNTDPNDYTLPVQIICPCTTSITPSFAISQTICSGSAPQVLPTLSQNGISGTWTPSTINNASSGTYVFAPNLALFPCATSVSVAVSVIPVVTPTFTAISSSICQFDTPPILPNVSTNTFPITGTWNPATINTTNVGQTIYTFVPDTGQCTSTVPYQISITITPSVTSNFPPINAICVGAIPPLLSTIAPNGVTGTWSPAIVSNLASGNYEFTPSATGCVAKQILQVTVLPQQVPNFTNISFCKGDIPPVLPTVSPNGITGTWSPSVINPLSGGNYLFTPNAFQCALSQTIAVTLNQSLVQSVDYEVSGSFSDTPTLSIVVLPVGSYLYQLDGGTIQTSPTFYNVSPGQHQVTVTDSNGCNRILLIDDITIINYPSFFTPNGDGFNDYWNITGLTGSNKAFTYIYDRFGKLLKQIKPMGQGWDGTYKGRLMPSTDYWFRIEYIENHVQKEFSSHFALKR